MKTSEQKKEYQRAYQKRYYYAHKEKALAYQAVYRKRFITDDKRRLQRDCPVPQNIEKRCFSIGDLTKAPTAKFQRQIEMVLSGQMGLVV